MVKLDPTCINIEPTLLRLLQRIFQHLHDDGFILFFLWPITHQSVAHIPIE